MHTPILETRRELWSSEAACAASAQRLAAQNALGQAFITLRGPLGAGKTSFARHLLRALGVQGPIKSPTYGLVESYDLPSGPIHHGDFYRFNDPLEWEAAGVRDLLAGAGLKLIEWPELAGESLPMPDLDIFIQPQWAERSSEPPMLEETDQQIRLVTWTAHTALGAQLLA